MKAYGILPGLPEPATVQGDGAHMPHDWILDKAHELPPEPPLQRNPVPGLARKLGHSLKVFAAAP
jgi:hypothetical protein